jgi:hypothetical protein
MMKQRRRRFKQTTSLVERLRQFANDARKQASHLPEGHMRNQLLERAQISERAIEIEGWLSTH